MSAMVHSNSQPLSLLFPPNPQFRNNPSSSSSGGGGLGGGRARGGGILINSSRSPSASPVSRSTSLPITPENYGGTTSPYPAHSTSTGGDRKIRFAPLPDPRKLSSDEDSSIHESIEDRSPILPPDLVVSEVSGTSTISSSNSDEGSSSRDNNGGNSKDTNSVGKSSGSKRWKKKLLKPFLAASPVKSAFEDGGMLGTNLFRASSRESFQSWNEHDTITEPPHRRRSTSADTHRPPTVLPSVPLRPTISADAAAPTKKLLNGRVYGQQRTTKPPTEKYQDPEFVEWGYGGMGSVKSGEMFYNGVQSGGSMMMAGDEDDDDYDGSGMKWVKRRRAQREREAAEREKREREEGNAPVITVHSPPHTPKDEKTNRLAMTMSSISPPTSSPPTPGPTSPSEEHDTTTVSVPHHHHSTHRGASRTTSGTTTPTITKELKELNVSGIPGISASAPLSASTDGDDEEEDEEDEDEEKDGSDSEEDSDESEADESRRTCKCAGVEKVSRHRE